LQCLKRGHRAHALLSLFAVRSWLWRPMTAAKSFTPSMSLLLVGLCVKTR
jgi:hypothetical protein